MTGEMNLILLGLAVGVPLATAPDAVTTATILEVPRRGKRAGLRAAGGRLLADALAIFVLAALSLSPPRFLWREGRPVLAIGLAAGFVLLVRGLTLMDQRTAGALSRDGTNGLPPRTAHPLLNGFLTAVLRPGWHLFWWTAGLVLLLWSARWGAAGLGIVAASILLPDLLWPTFLARRLAGDRRETALTDRQYRILTSLGGLALVAVGLFFGNVALAGSGIREAFESVVARVFL